MDLTSYVSSIIRRKMNDSSEEEITKETQRIKEKYTEFLEPIGLDETPIFPISLEESIAFLAEEYARHAAETGEYVFSPEEQEEDRKKLGQNELNVAVISGNKSEVISLIEDDITITAKDNNGFTPYMYAILYERPEIAEILSLAMQKKEKT